MSVMAEKLPSLMIERPKMPRATWDALRAHIVRERQRKKHKLEQSAEVRLYIFVKNQIWHKQVNLCQKHLFSHQLNHNMKTHCSLNYKFNSWKFQAQTWGEHVVNRNCFWHSEQFLYTTWSAKRRASDKDLPVHFPLFSCMFLNLNIFFQFKF